jgi:hypothetical protein
MKIFLTTSVLCILIFFTTHSALAATTAVLSPSAVSTAPGKTFTVSIRVDPKGTANYAEKVVLNYPADLLKVDSFSFGSGWTPLTQSGYDSIDNTHGVLIKTAGYPSGITTATSFGTVTFSVKKAGTGSISIGNGSEAFEKDDQSAITGNAVGITSSAAAAVVSQPQAAPAPMTTAVPSATTQKSAPATTISDEVPLIPEKSDPEPVTFTEEVFEDSQVQEQKNIPPVVLEGGSGEERQQSDQTGLMWFFVISVTIVVNAGCVIFWLLRMKN